MISHQIHWILKEGLQNVRYLNQNATEPKNKKPSTKNTADTDLVNTDVEVTAETKPKGLNRNMIYKTVILFQIIIACRMSNWCTHV